MTDIADPGFTALQVVVLSFLLLLLHLDVVVADMNG
jgi:hypothetical protein